MAEELVYVTDEVFVTADYDTITGKPAIYITFTDKMTENPVGIGASEGLEIHGRVLAIVYPKGKAPYAYEYDVGPNLMGVIIQPEPPVRVLTVVSKKVVTEGNKIEIYTGLVGRAKALFQR